MKFLSIFFLNLLFSSSCFAEKIPNKLEILHKTNECLKVPQKQECRNLILDLENLQFIALESNNLKCQASILGLQTELVEAHFFENDQNKSIGIMIPYVIKNC